MVRTSLMLMTAAYAVVAVACGSGVSSLNGNKLEQQITRRLKAEKVELKQIACPEGRPLKKDDTFECTATARNNTKLKVQAKQTDHKGSVEWAVTSGLLAVDKVQTLIEEDFMRVPEPEGPLTVAVKCEKEGTLAISDGGTFTCSVANTKPPNDTTTVKVTANSKAENERGFDWAPLDPA